MANDKLSIYNTALTQFIGTRKLASLTENREPRRILDDIWDFEFEKFILEQGLWNFAIRTVKADYSPSVEPDFGFRYAFDKPEDWIRTAAIASDEFFSNPLTATQYRDEAGFWFSSLQTIYVRYICMDPQYGLNYALWPATFSQWVACELAQRAVLALSQDKDLKAYLEKKSKSLLVDARSKDAMNDGTQFQPRGRWVSDKGGWSGTRFDYGWRR